MATCPNCHTQLPDGQPFCNVCGTPVQAQDPTQAPANALPMKWHKAMVYFIIWLNILLNISSIIIYLGGFSYIADGEVVADEVYAQYPALQIIDLFYAIFSLVMVALLLFVWFRLHGFKQGAWILPTILYAVNGVVALIYSFAIDITLEGELVDALLSAAKSTIPAVLLAVLNYIYYKKRASLFVN